MQTRMRVRQTWHGKYIRKRRRVICGWLRWRVMLGSTPAVSRAYYAVFHAEIAALLKLTDFRPLAGTMIVYRRSSTVGSFARKAFSTTLRFIHNDMIGRRHIADYEAERLGGWWPSAGTSELQDMRRGLQIRGGSLNGWLEVLVPQPRRYQRYRGALAQALTGSSMSSAVCNRGRGVERRRKMEKSVLTLSKRLISWLP